MKNKIMISWLLIVGVAGIGFCSILLATVLGVGVTPDAVAYLQGAANIAKGIGYMGENYCADTAYPIMHWPPFFSFVLSLGADAGVAPVSGARWLNATLFMCNIALTGFILKKHTNSVFFSVLGCLFVLSAFPMLETHSAAWTEPLFFFLGLSGLYALGCYLQKGNLAFLLFAGIAIGMSILTRYAGIAFVLTACFVIAFPGRWGMRKRIMELGIFALLSLLPFTLFVLRNYQISGNFTNRKLEYDLALINHIDAMITSFASWILPGVDRFHFLPAQNMLVLVIFAVAAILWLVLVFRLLWSGNSKSSKKSNYPGAHASFCVFCVFVFFYIAMLWLSAIFSSAPPPIDNRLLSPIMIPVVILAVCGLHKIFTALQSKSLKKFISIFVVTVSAVYLVAGAMLVFYLFENGRGYTGRSWQYEALHEKINALPQNARLFSNQPGFIVFSFNRCVRNLAKSSAGIASGLKNLSADLDTKPSAFIIYFENARQFTPRKKGAQGQKELAREDLQQAMAEFNPKLVLHERNAYLYEITIKSDGAETSIRG